MTPTRGVTRQSTPAPQRRYIHRDQVPPKSLTDFQWTRDGSAAHRRAAGSDAPVKMAALQNIGSGRQLPLGATQDINGGAKENALSGGIVVAGQAHSLTGDKKGASQGGGREPGGGFGGGGLGGRGPRTTASSKVEPSGFFNKFGSGRVLPVGAGGTGPGGGAEGGDQKKKRRGTHDGVIGTSEREPAIKLIHFKPRPTDSAGQV